MSCLHPANKVLFLGLRDRGYEVDVFRCRVCGEVYVVFKELARV